MNTKVAFCFAMMVGLRLTHGASASAQGWEEPIDISGPGADAFAPSVATAPDGTGVAVWQRRDGTAKWIEAAVRVGGTWGSVSVISAASRRRP